MNELSLAILVFYFRQNFANKVCHNNQRIILHCLPQRSKIHFSDIPQGNAAKCFNLFFTQQIFACLKNDFDVSMKYRVLLFQTCDFTIKQ